MLSIVEPTTTAGDGITRPRLCRLSDDEFYYVKGRRVTPQGLVNELVCGHLGQALGLPIPEFSLTEVPQLPTASAFAELRSDLGFGVLFASRRVSNLMELDLSQAKRVPEPTRRDVAAFDYWVGNGDRTLTEFGGNPNCSIPDDHIDPRRSALFMARLLLREVRDGGRRC
ncbi:HipA family kinase [Rhodovulum sulfidophilum]|uniref:HipA family kinase n=1 Tax=Rhodovulum sulfidophilum TaxID=35806 RepID=UPI0034DF98F1